MVKQLSIWGLIAITGLVAALAIGGPHDSKETVFWKWFELNEDRLFHYNLDQDRVFDDLSRALDRVHPDLTFEFGTVDENQKEFVISADGIKSVFPAVESLYAAAPQLPRWSITKFRPRRKPLAIQIGDIRIAPEMVRIAIAPDGDKVNMEVFLEGYDESLLMPQFQVVFLVLDHAVGEYDVETKVGFIDLRPFEESREIKTYSVEELPTQLDMLTAGHEHK